MDGWLYKREGEYLETIQRFITQLSDSGNIFLCFFEGNLKRNNPREMYALGDKKPPH